MAALRQGRGKVVVTLQSNSNMDKCPQNKPTEFTVVLRTALDFGNDHRDWEVALQYVQFTQGWNNLRKDCVLRFLVKVPKLVSAQVASAAGHQELFVREIPFNDEGTYDWDLDDNVMSLHFDDLTEATDSKIKKEEWVYFKAHMRANNFPSVQAMLDHFTRLFDMAFTHYGATLGYEVSFTTGFVKLIPSRCSIMMFEAGTYFADLLGLPSKLAKKMDYSRITTMKGAREASVYAISLEGTRKPRLDVLHSIYVYSDVVESQPVGDTEAPLLGVVPIGDVAAGHRIDYRFKTRDFLPVSQAYIKNIRIKLATDEGEPIPFASASDNVVCSLRFQRRPSKYQEPFVL
jgi:hypothetical protein